MPICPRGHESQAEDWCDFCGFPMSPPPGVAVPGASPFGAPGAPGSSRPMTQPDSPLSAALNSPLNAPLNAPHGRPDVTAGLVTCPICRTPQTGRYCEECGYDYDLSAPSHRQPAPPAPPTAPPAYGYPPPAPTPYQPPTPPPAPAPAPYQPPVPPPGPAPVPEPSPFRPPSPFQPPASFQGQGQGHGQGQSHGQDPFQEQSRSQGQRQQHQGTGHGPGQGHGPGGQRPGQAPFPGQDPFQARESFPPFEQAVSFEKPAAFHEQPGYEQSGPVYAQPGPTAPGDEFGTPFRLAPPVPGAGAAPASGPGVTPVRTTWMAVVSADRDYFTDMMARSGPEAAGLFFPPYCPERRIPLTGRGQLRIGRRSQHKGTVPEIDLSVAPEDPGASHQHALLAEQADGSWVLVDQDSTNGTTVNGGADPVPPHTAIPLNDGDRIHVGAWTTITLHRA